MQTIQFDIKWDAGDKEYSAEEITELLESGLGRDYDNTISNVRLGAAVSAQDEHELGDPLWPIYQKYAEESPKPLLTYSGWLRTIAQKLERELIAAAPAQEPREDLYVISSTGDGARTIIVPESKLKQSVHDTYCSCGLDWQKCADEVVAETLAKVDDEEEWTREYPAYKRHVWGDDGEDYTVTIMRVTAAQEPPVENISQKGKS